MLARFLAEALAFRADNKHGWRIELFRVQIIRAIRRKAIAPETPFFQIRNGRTTCQTPGRRLSHTERNRTIRLRRQKDWPSVLFFARHLL